MHSRALDCSYASLSGGKQQMKVRIDRDLCRGVGACVANAPKVFQLDNEEKAVVIDAHGASDDDIWQARNPARSTPLSWKMRRRESRCIHSSAFFFDRKDAKAQKFYFLHRLQVFFNRLRIERKPSQFLRKSLCVFAPVRFKIKGRHKGYAVTCSGATAHSRMSPNSSFCTTATRCRRMSSSSARKVMITSRRVGTVSRSG